MAIVVKVPTQLRAFTDGRVGVEASGASISDALADLDENHPGILSRILADDGSVRRFVNIYLGDENIRFLDGLDTALSDGDVLSIIPAVAGGSR